MVEAYEVAEVPMSSMSERKHDSTYGEHQGDSLAQELRQMDGASPNKSIDDDEEQMPLNIAEYLQQHQVSLQCSLLLKF